MSGKSSNTTRVGSEGVDAGFARPEKSQTSQKDSVADASKFAPEGVAHEQPAAKKPASEKAENAAPGKAGKGLAERFDNRLTDGFLFADWGNMTPPPMNEATVEAAREQHRKHLEKRAS